MIWIPNDLPVAAPYKVGDKVTWREQIHTQESLKRFKDKWGDGPFVVTSVVRRKNTPSFVIKVKSGRWFVYSLIPSECHKGIPIGRLREWESVDFELVSKK